MHHLPLLTGLFELVDVPNLSLFLKDLLVPLRCQEFVSFYVLVQLVVAGMILATDLFAFLLLNLSFELFEVFEFLKLPMKKARNLALLGEDVGAPAEQICNRFLLPQLYASFLMDRVHFDC